MAGRLPQFVGVGSVSESTTTVTPTYPAQCQEGDFVFLFVETAGQDAQLPVNVRSDWQEVGMASNTGTRVQCYWRRWSVGDIPPTLPDSGDHANAVIVAYRYCDPIQPWDILTAASTGTAVGTNQELTIGGGTTTVDNCVVLMMVVDDVDGNAGGRFSAYANADLAGIAEIVDSGTTNGNGGGFAVMRATKAVAGAFGATTLRDSSNNPVWAGRHIVLRPEQPEPDYDDFPYVADVSSYGATSIVSTHSVPLPKRRRPGDFLLFMGMADGNVSWTRPAGWNINGVLLSGGGTGTGQSYWRVCDGTEDDTLSITLSGNDEIAVVVYALRNMNPGSIFTSTRTVTLGTPDNPSVNPIGWNASEKTLWICAIGSLGTVADDNDWPSGFDKYRVQIGASTVSTIHVCCKEEAVSSQDPASWGAAFSASSHYRQWTVGVRQRQYIDRPSLISGVGVFDASTSGDVTVDLGQPRCYGDGDVGVVVIETNAAGPVITVPAGWAHVAGSPVVGAASRLNVLWKRLTETDGSSIFNVQPTTGNHRIARAFSIRGCKVITNPDFDDPPFRDVVSGTLASAQTHQLPGFVTTIDGCLVCIIVASPTDVGADNTPEFSGWASEHLLNFEEYMDTNTGQGDGGGMGVAVGDAPNKGWYGPSQVTLTAAAASAYMIIPFLAHDAYRFGEDDRGVVDYHYVV